MGTRKTKALTACATLALLLAACGNGAAENTAGMSSTESPEAEYLNVSLLDGRKTEIEYAVNGEEGTAYRYRLCRINEDTGEEEVLITSRAASGEKQVYESSALDSGPGDYSYRLDIYGKDGVLSSSETSDTLSYGEIIRDPYPEISLDYGFDGKTFYSFEATVTGKVKNAFKAYVDGEETDTDINGAFTYGITLLPGENKVSLKAVDMNDREAVSEAVLYCGLNEDGNVNPVMFLKDKWAVIATGLLLIMAAAVIAAYAAETYRKHTGNKRKETGDGR